VPLPPPTPPPDRRRGALALGVLIGCFWLLTGCGQEPGSSGSSPPAAGDRQVESFTFFDLGRHSILGGAVRERLESELGAAAVERRGIVELAPDGRGLLARHTPALDRLNRRLNNDFRERVEHDVDILMYRYPERTAPAFESVRLVFDGRTGRPLHFQTTANEAGGDILAVLEDKYGAPRRIEDEKGPILLWERDDDRLLVLPRTSRLGRPEYLIRIYFANNIERLLAREARGRNDEGAGGARSAF